MTDKPAKITQRVDQAGTPSKASDQPGWFLTHASQPAVFNATSAISKAALPTVWGELFAPPRPGNDVDFHVDGQEYFTEVAKAIKAARHSVFIAGWQVNYAVQLGHGDTLLSCLDQAVENGATVYVMPWLAPPGPIDTGYTTTPATTSPPTCKANSKPTSVTADDASHALPSGLPSVTDACQGEP